MENMAYHDLRGGDIFRKFTFDEARKAINGCGTDWQYGLASARIAITMITNNIGAYESAELLGITGGDEELTDTEEDVIAVAEWVKESLNYIEP